MEITINPKKVRTVLLAVISILAVLHVSQLILYYVIGDPNKFEFIELLDFDYEANLPSLYSMLAIILCSGVLFLIAYAKKKNQQSFRFHWLLLAWIFLFLGFDEGASLHEDLGDLMEEFITATGYLYFPWVIPYTALLVVLSAFYFRFIFHLPESTRMRFTIAAVLFLGGAVGLEMISAHEADMNGTTTIAYSVLYTIEELCEMIAIVIFLQALLEYYSREFGALTIKFPE